VLLIGSLPPENVALAMDATYKFPTLSGAAPPVILLGPAFVGLEQT